MCEENYVIIVNMCKKHLNKNTTKKIESEYCTALHLILGFLQLPLRCGGPDLFPAERALERLQLIQGAPQLGLCREKEQKNFCCIINCTYDFE